jgi:hypothetical protein
LFWKYSNNFGRPEISRPPSVEIKESMSFSER